MSEYTYRATAITTEDYGPAAGSYATATLALVPDGSFWRDRPEIIKIGVPVGTRPGGLWRVVIEPVQS